MKAYYMENDAAELRTDYPDPLNQKPNHAVIKVSKAGICRTDLEITKGYMHFTGVLGHEFVGVVQECRDRQWIGRRVVSEINFSCGQCALCTNGLESHCPTRKVMGIKGHDGCLAEYISVPTAGLHLLPDTISDEEATFIEPLAACFEILEQIHLHPASNIVILGAGKLGLLAAQVIKTVCADVTIVAKHPEKLDLARQLGIKAFTSDQIQERSKTVIDCTGSPDGLQLAQKLVIPRGTIIMKSTYAHAAPVDITPLVVNEISLIGSRCGPFHPAINALKRKLVDVKPLISASYPLDKIDEAFEAAKLRNNFKILVDIA